ncbi:MAG: hypothetical protein N2C14_24505 [Planctomycetales bacterium]
MPTNSPTIDFRKIVFAIVFSLSILFVNLSGHPISLPKSVGGAGPLISFYDKIQRSRGYGWPMTAAREIPSWTPSSIMVFEIRPIGLLVNIAFSFVLLCQAVRAIERWAPRFSIRFLLALMVAAAAVLGLVKAEVVAFREVVWLPIWFSFACAFFLAASGVFARVKQSAVGSAKTEDATVSETETPDYASPESWTPDSWKSES